jgi:ribosomal protein L30E
MRSMKGMAFAAVAVAALSVGTATALAAIQTGTYVGTTGQVENGVHGKVKLVVTQGNLPGVEHVKLFKYKFHATCQVHSTGYTNTFGAHNMKISNKQFQDVGKFTFAGPGGLTAHAKVAVAGGFTKPGHALGSFGVKITFTNPDGSVNDHCNSGVVNWHAHT